MNEQEMQELQQLRAEKLHREQTQRARAALENAGIPTAFAELLCGADDADTDHRAEQFRSAYQAALTEDIRQRLPQQAPVVAVPSASRPQRGIKRLR